MAQNVGPDAGKAERREEPDQLQNGKCCVRRRANVHGRSGNEHVREQLQRVVTTHLS